MNGKQFYFILCDARVEFHRCTNPVDRATASRSFEVNRSVLSPDCQLTPPDRLENQKTVEGGFIWGRRTWPKGDNRSQTGGALSARVGQGRDDPPSLVPAAVQSPPILSASRASPLRHLPPMTSTGQLSPSAGSTTIHSTHSTSWGPK